MPLRLKYATWYKYYDSCPTGLIIKKGRMEQMLKNFDSNLSAKEAKAKISKNGYHFSCKDRFE